MGTLNYRAKAFKKKFSNASHQLGVRPNEVVSLKLRENVSSYAEYREFLRALEHEAGVRWSAVDGDLQGQGYILSDGNSRVIIVEHETGLEILYIAGSIASVISLVPLILQGWHAFRGRHSGRRDFDDRGLEIRRLDEQGHLSEDRLHDAMALTPMSFSVNNAVASAAKTMECDLHQLRDQVRSLTHRVEVLEKRMATKKRKPGTGKKCAAKKSSQS